MSLGLKIKEIRTQKKITQTELAEKTGISRRMISAYEGDENDITLSKLISLAAALDIPPSSLLDEKTNAKNQNLNANILSKAIPLVNVKAVGGFGNESFSINKEDIKEYYVIPKFKYNRIDFMIEVTGTSMSPRYISGDIVACQIIKNNSFIQWNRVHVIATRDQGIILKRIQQSSKTGYFRVLADNPAFPPFDIPISEITGLALVAGGVTIE